VTEGIADAARGVILARRCPGWIAAVWAWQAALALLVAWPAASIVGKAFGPDPRGDGPLWDAGAHSLLVFLSRDSHALSGVWTLAALVLVIAAVAGLLPSAAIMLAMSEAAHPGGRRSIARVVAGAFAAFPALGVLLVILGLAETATVAVAWLVTTCIEAVTHDVVGEARANVLEIAAAIAFAPLAAVIWIVHDLAGASVVRFRVGAASAVWLGARAFALAPWSLCWAWAWRTGLSWVMIVPASTVADAVAGRGGAALLLLACTHQSTLAVRTALHASWAARALRNAKRSAYEDERGPR